jgi:hypothetical protein
MNDLNTENRELSIDELEHAAGGSFFDRINAMFPPRTGLAHLASLALWEDGQKQ